MTEQTYDRLFLAKAQLETALDLFLDHQNYASSITLAGAAEEVFGRALAIGGMNKLRQLLSGQELRKKEFVSKENLARDALKHLQEGTGPTFTVDMEVAACWMLVRALQNGGCLQPTFERSYDFDNWFYENVVGV